MAKKPPKKPKPEEIETEPGAWERFERTIDVLVHTPPKPHKRLKTKDSKKRGKSRGKRDG